MKIDLKLDGLDRAVLLTQGFSERRISAALATALSRTAVAGKDAARADMSTSFDRPTPYALGGLYVYPATAKRLQAEVEIIDNPFVTGTPAVKFLQPGVLGGSRHVKRFEQALQAAGAMPTGWHSVPAMGARLDAYGNIQRGQLVQILSQLGTELTAGYRRSLPRRLDKKADAKQRRAVDNKRRRAFGRAGGQYVALPQGRGKLKPGIYLAAARDFGAKWGLGRTGGLQPVLLFVRSTAYRARFDFYGVVTQVVDQRLGFEAGRAIAEQLARLKAGRVEA